jgi:hypothetical protein
MVYTCLSFLVTHVPLTLFARVCHLSGLNVGNEPSIDEADEAEAADEPAAEEPEEAEEAAEAAPEAPKHDEL